MEGWGAWHPDMMLSSNRRRQRSELRPHPKEEAMSHALATVLHRGRKAASNLMAACLASSREFRRRRQPHKLLTLGEGRDRQVEGQASRGQPSRH